MSGAGTLPPLFVITDDDHGGYVCVAVYTLLILMVATVGARLFTRWHIVRFIKSDDILLILAMVRIANAINYPKRKLNIADLRNRTEYMYASSCESWSGKEAGYRV